MKHIENITILLLSVFCFYTDHKLLGITIISLYPPILYPTLIILATFIFKKDINELIRNLK